MKKTDYTRDGQILSFIYDYAEKNGCAPTYREIGDAVGLSSLSTVSVYITRLIRHGILTAIPGTPRSLRLRGMYDMGEPSNDGYSMLCCKVKLPAGAYPVSVIAMVPDEGGQGLIPIRAEEVTMTRQSYQDKR